MTQSALFDETMPALPPLRVNATVHLAEAPRLSKQCGLILERLRANGTATNRELSLLSLKYTSRISEIRQAGYDVRVISRDHETGLNTYALVLPAAASSPTPCEK